MEYISPNFQIKFFSEDVLNNGSNESTSTPPTTGENDLPFIGG